MLSLFTTKQQKNISLQDQPAVVDFGTIAKVKKTNDTVESSEKRGILGWVFGIRSKKADDNFVNEDPTLTNVNSNVLKMKKIEVGDSEFIDIGNGKLSYAEVALFNVSDKHATNKLGRKSISKNVIIIDQDLDLARSITDIEMVEEYKKHEQFNASDFLDVPPAEDQWDDYVESKTPLKMRKKKNIKKNKN